MTPDVTVVIPTFDRRTLVREAIASCRSQGLGPALEILVVDDGSSDGTCDELAGAPDVTLLALEKNRGRNVARNAGLRAARGRWVKFLDSDDVLLPETLDVELRAGDAAGADIVLSGHREEHTLPSGELATKEMRVVPPVLEPRIDALLAGRAVPTSAALYRRAALAGVSWDESIDKLDDWEFFLQAALVAGPVVGVPHVSYTIREHPGRGVHANSRLGNAHEHHLILRKLERALEERRELTPPRRLRLAQYYYRELRLLSFLDRPGFDRALAHILELDPSFRPRDEEPRAEIRFLARLLGVRSALLLYAFVKRTFLAPRAAVPA